jgi:hypothetical protein
MQNEISPLERFETAGMIARWQPVHRGHLVVLRALAERSRQVRIGIGSSNEYNYRCPFTLPETLDMLRLALGDRQNFSLIPVPDLHNGPRWREMVLQLFGSLDLFVTANPYVRSLLLNRKKLPLKGAWCGGKWPGLETGRPWFRMKSPVIFRTENWMPDFGRNLVCRPWQSILS